MQRGARSDERKSEEKNEETAYTARCTLHVNDVKENGRMEKGNEGFQKRTMR